MQRHLFTAEGLAALGALFAQRPLVAFDFDGTLTPIVDHPDDAQLTSAVATRLSALEERLPLAIVTGRAVADVRARLGFTPRFIVGNHGAEDYGAGGDAGARHAAALDGLRAALAAEGAALVAAGVGVEDKLRSIALHYRLAPDPAVARALIDALLESHLRRVEPGAAALRVFAGKMVVNAVAESAPDKADAVHALVERAGAGAAFFAGDDVNDEPVFAAALPHWLTVRVGCGGTPSKARWCLDSPAEMPALLEHMLAHLNAGAVA